MTTQGTETRQGQDLQGLGAKHDGPFGAADAPQTTDNGENIVTTSEQQAVPVAQEISVRENLQGYYIGFEPTGDADVDRILGTIAYAAKMFHSTDGWTDDTFGSPTCEENIQNAANLAAANRAALTSDRLADAPPNPDATQTREAEGDTVKFVQDWLMNADYDPTQFDKDFAAAIDARKTLTDAELQAAAERFCATPLPETVCADLVAIKPMSGRTGTNLMTVAEAKEMLRAALNARGGA